MAGPLGKLTVVLGVDAREFQKGISDAQGALGKFGVSTGSIVRATGVAVAGGFAFMTKGALEAEKAQGAFMAATGKSREEAKKFVSGMDSLAGSAGAVGMSFEDIAKTGTMVEQQFGTTGKATTDLTENILEFSKVTGQDATQAAADLEDTLSAYGLTAADAAGLMNQLVASNQKFGTDAGPAATDALRNMSASLQAVGGDLTDGVGFLNLFETAGLDANAAATGLTKAIKGLKPGQTLDDLIAQVGAIEDPLARAQKAAEIFGTKAGPKLAQAIKPGMTSLDDFKVSAEDAAGTTSKAADDMLTLTDRLQGWAEKALAGARELGQQFGPLISGLGAVLAAGGPMLATGLGKAWDSVASSSVVQKAVGLAGEAAGAVYAAIAGAVEAIGLTIKGAWIAMGAPGSGVMAAAAEAGSSAGAAFSGGLILGLGTLGLAFIAKFGTDALDNLFPSITPTSMLNQAAKNGTDAGAAAGAATIDEYQKAWDAGTIYGPPPPGIITAAVDAGEQVGTEAGTAAAAAVTPAWQTEMDAQAARNKNSMAMYQIMTANHDAQTAAAEKIWNESAHAITGDLVGTLKGAKDDISSAMDDLLWAMNHPMAMEKDVLKIQAELNSDTLAKGLASSNSEIHDTAVQTQQKLLDLWKSLDPKGYAAAHQASVSISDGLSSEYPEMVREARGVVNMLNAQFADLKTNYHINVSSGGNRFGAEGLRAGGGPVTAGMAYIVGEQRPELFVPSTNGTILPSVPGATTINLTVNAPNGDGESIAQAVKRTLADYFGNARAGSTMRWSPG